MTPSRPYLIRAIYDWLLDNHQTPYILINATFPQVSVPLQFVKEGKIILNIAPAAVGGLALGNQVVEFKARFSGSPYHIVVPVMAVEAIYSYENGRGMVFNEEDPYLGPDDASDGAAGGTPPHGRPNLRVIK